MSRFKVSPRADGDLGEIWDFIAIERSKPVAAQKLLEKLCDTFSLLATRPFIGQLRNELSPGVRSFSVGNYVIYYRSIDDGIEVAAVVHGARDVDSLFRDRPL